jgi:hypothetical protein
VPSRALDADPGLRRPPRHGLTRSWCRPATCDAPPFISGSPGASPRQAARYLRRRRRLLLPTCRDGRGQP